MTQKDMAELMERIFEECRGLRAAGQKEYAHDEGNPFRNFEGVGKALGIPPEKALLVYAQKHWDGVVAWANGHRSQREDVSGRINDLIVYLCLLRGMADVFYPPIVGSESGNYRRKP